jgi:hypothetical protein
MDPCLDHPITKRDSADIAIMMTMTELVTPRSEQMGRSRIAPRSLRRRRRLDLRALATGAALFVAVAWTIFFGVGVVLR